MNNKEKKYVMDQEHYDNVLAGIEMLKKKRAELNMGRKDAFDSSAGDGWDSPEFEELERQERMIIGQIEEKLLMLKNAVIIESQNKKDVIDVGDIVRINIDFGNNDIEESIYKLTGGVSGDIDGLTNISINSPLGASIYQKKIGEDTSYTVNANNFKVTILEKIIDFNQEHKKIK